MKSNAIRKEMRREERLSRKAARIDQWFNRASQLSQVLLLLLGVFGYFYTVLPLYQKALLDEEIAQKTLELKEMQKRSVALAEQIDRQSQELRAKDKQVLTAQQVAAAAKVEAIENYHKLRVEYVGLAVTAYRRCAWKASGRDLDGTELASCSKDVLASVEQEFRSLRPQDRKLFIEMLGRAIAKLEEPFSKIVADQREKLVAYRSKAEETRRRIDALKADTTQDSKQKLENSSTALQLSIDLLLKDEVPKIRRASYEGVVELVNASATKLFEDYLNAASSN
jgi:hypothetical protein